MEVDFILLVYVDNAKHEENRVFIFCESHIGNIKYEDQLKQRCSLQVQH